MTEPDLPPAPPPMLDHEPLRRDWPADPPRRGGGGGAILSALLALLLFGAVEAQLLGYVNPAEFGLGVPAAPAASPDAHATDALRQQAQALAQANAQTQSALQAATQDHDRAQSLAQQVQSLAEQSQSLVQQLPALVARVDSLEKSAPAPGAPAQAPDQGDLSHRIDDLTARVTALQSQPPSATQDPGAGQQAIAALSQRLDQLQTSDKAAIDQEQDDAKTAISEAQSAGKNALDQMQSALQTRIQSAVQDSQKQVLAQTQQNALSQQQAMLGQEKAALDALDTRIVKLEQGAGSVEDAATRATRLERVQGAVVALQAGNKLGEIPNAPPALARFANTAPPTESALRESFPALAAHARAISQPALAGKSFLQRAFAHLQESVTVRQGNDVIVGDPASGVLADAELKVQNGDLAGAVQRLGALQGPAAAAMKPWMDEAEALVAAREALATLAARG